MGRWPQFSGKAILWIPNTKSGILQKYFDPKIVIFKNYFNTKSGIFQKYFDPKSVKFKKYFNTKSGIIQKYFLLFCYAVDNIYMNTLDKGHDSGWLNINRGRRISIKIINHWHALVLALKCPSRSISNPHTSSLYKTDFSFEWAYSTLILFVIVVSRIKSSRYQPFQVKYPDQYTVHFSHDCKLSGNHFTWRAVKTKEITTS